MSDNPSDPIIQAPAPAAAPDPGPPRAVIRNKAKAVGKKRGPAKGFRAGIPRATAPRTAEPRTADDARTDSISMEAAPPPPSAMPRDSGGFAPDYDGPSKRMSREDRDTNQFELPPSVRRRLTNAGWDGAFKVMSIYNQPVDGTDILMVHNAGWRPAKAKDLPELVGPGTAPDAPIDRHGQRFFIRPMWMTRQAQEEDYQFANAQMKTRMTASQEGRNVGSDGTAGLADMNRIVQPVPIKLEVEGESGTHGAR